MRARNVSRALTLATVAVTAALGLVAAPAAAAGAPSRQPLTITSVSNPRPGLISGGQVLLRVTVPPHTSPGDVHVRAAGRDVTADFAAQHDGSLLGLVGGLPLGSSRVAVRTDHATAALTVDNHRLTGPVFSGAQQRPFYCQTTAFGLAPAVQPYCTAPTQITYDYGTTAGTFAPLADPRDRPADLATATVHGRQVPYIVRVETGTIDRAVYQVAALYDGTDPSPLRRDRSWNDRLVYTFGGGCNGGYHQGSATGGVLNDLFLSQGYAVASSSLNVLDTNCSTIISAEAAMMVKEHVIETYGPVAHTIGWGGSGGAIQQYDIADAYPGILDGIVPGVSFPDPLTTLDPVTDCRLLNRYFAGAGSSVAAAQQLAVAGFPSYDTCQSWDVTFASRVTATDSCDPAVPVSARWDPVTNPDGVKCSADEQYVNQLGRNPATGFVRSTLDNVGVQYGLQALDSGQLTAAEFAQLNADIGGYDYTGKVVPQRSVADPKALRAAYTDDLVNSAGLGLATTPIIDQRTDLDQAGAGNDIHTTQWSYVMRDRLLHANGTYGNQVIIENQPTADQIAAANTYELAAMDQWLTRIEADGSSRSQQQKVLHDKPAGLGDGCYLSATQRIVATLTYPASGQCAASYPVGSDTRLVAGAPLSENVLKCRLHPLDLSDYPVTFTTAEQAQLRSAFPTGVCDYSRPGVGQRPPAGTWLNYGDRAGAPPV